MIHRVSTEHHTSIASIDAEVLNTIVVQWPFSDSKTNQIKRLQEKKTIQTFINWIFELETYAKNEQKQ